MAFESQFDTVVLYHKNCLDGLAAAWVVWCAHEGKVDLAAVQYDNDFAERFGPNWEDLAGKNVICVDFAFNIQETKSLMGIAKLLVLDHHASAWKDLESIAWNDFTKGFEQWHSRPDDYTNSVVVVDSGYSGAMLAWMWFNPGIEPPQGIKFAEDYDLWKFRYPETKNWVAAAFSYEMTVENFNKVIATPVDEMVVEGRAIQRHIEKTVKGLSRSQRRFQLDEYDVPIVNANSLFRNELGAILSANEPFSLTYSDSRNGRQYSLRSKKGTGVDVSVLAKRFGGGGHANSAAFSISMDDEQFHHSHVSLSSTCLVKVDNSWEKVPRYKEKE